MGKYTNNLQKALDDSRDEAFRLMCFQVEIGHLLIAILRNKKSMAFRICSDLIGEKTDELLAKANEISKGDARSFPADIKRESIPNSEDINHLLVLSQLAQKKVPGEKIGTLHFLLAICQRKSPIRELLLQYGIGYSDVLGLYNDSYRNQFDKEIADEIKNKLKDLLPPSKYITISDIPPDKIRDMEERFFRNRRERKQEKENANGKSSPTPYLSNFGRDLTQKAKDGLLDPIVGREKEISRIIRILSRRKKNNPILIGDAGVGKSAVVEGIAQKIAQGDVPYTLCEKQIYSLDLAAVVAGTKYRGQFEERLKGLISELEQHPEIIIFIDEIHTMIGAGGAEGSLDASNILKPALARGEIQCIGATTIEEYRKYFETDKALDRRFQKILIDPENIEESILILTGIKDKYEDYHNVKYTPEAIEACVRLSERYITDKNLPDKAIDLLDEAGAKAHVQNVKKPQAILDLKQKIKELTTKKEEYVSNQQFEEADALKFKLSELESDLQAEKDKWEQELKSKPVTIDYDKITAVVSEITGIEANRVSKNETKRLLDMEEILKRKIIGQNEAIGKIAKAIRRSRTGLKDPDRPIGSFLFVGSTGVGKTYLAKSLAEYLFDSSKNFIRIDMSEYMEKFSVSRLVGAPPGYVGYEQAGQLTEGVRQNPYSIVLFDEIEKAHKDVFNILLQILDEGHITDSKGRKVDFKNTVLIMTSNVGSRNVQDFGTGVGFSTKNIEQNTNAILQNIIDKDIRKTFAPEFLNRIDDIVFFNALTNENLIKIVDLELVNLNKRIESLGMSLKISKGAKQFLLDKDTQHKFGARPIKRTIQKEIEDPLAELLLQNKDNKKIVEVKLSAGQEKVLKFVLE